MRIASAGRMTGLASVSKAMSSVSGYASRRRSWRAAIVGDGFDMKNCDPRYTSGAGRPPRGSAMFM